MCYHNYNFGLRFWRNVDSKEHGNSFSEKVKGVSELAREKIKIADTGAGAT